MALFDYTSLPLVRQLGHVTGEADDAAILAAVPRASRFTDKFCARNSDADGYFVREDVSGEILWGIVDARGVIVCWPHKSHVHSVASFEWRANPIQAWKTVDTAHVQVRGRHEVNAWIALSSAYRGEVEVRISYNGGLAATFDDLPADFVEMVTLLAARFWKEGGSGLNDVIGLSELGVLQYAKALPQRYREMSAPYMRSVKW